MPQPPLPQHLRARWRDLPRLARLAAERISPPRTGPLDAATARAMWLALLAVHHAGGFLLTKRGALMIVSGARIRPARRLAQLVSLTAASTGCR